MKDKKQKKTSWISLMLAVVLLVMFMLFLIMVSEVEFNANCKVTGVSFQINETRDIGNIDFNNSEMECDFGGRVPVWLLGKV